MPPGAADSISYLPTGLMNHHLSTLSGPRRGVDGKKNPKKISGVFFLL